MFRPWDELIERTRAPQKLLKPEELNLLRRYDKHLTYSYYQLWAGLNSEIEQLPELTDKLKELYESLKGKFSLNTLNYKERAVWLELGSIISELLSSKYSQELNQRLYEPSIEHENQMISPLQAESERRRSDNSQIRYSLEEKLLKFYSEVRELKLSIWNVHYKVARELSGETTYLNAISKLKGIDYRTLLEGVKSLRDKLKQVYHNLLHNWLERTLGYWDEPINKSDLLWASTFKHYRLAWEPKALTGLLTGIDNLPESVQLDLEDRPNKFSRAACFPIEHGRDVRLVLRPTGGLDDAVVFAHELGHALNYGYMDPSLDWCATLSLGGALTETYAFLVEYSLLEPEVFDNLKLSFSSNLNRSELNCWLWTYQLYLFLRYTCKLEVEVFWHSASDPYQRLVEAERLYAELMTRILSVRFYPVEMVFDIDTWVYSGDYLIAWLVERALRYKMRRKGIKVRELVGLWRWGNLYSPYELLERLGIEPDNVSYYLLEWYEGLKHLRF